MKAREIYFGPYGTEIKKLNGGEDLSGSPDEVYFAEGPTQWRREIAHSYVDAGASIAVTDTFGARNFADDQDVYAGILEHQFRTLVQGVNGFSGQIAISLGPKAGCYDPDNAPDVSEAKDFHEYQLRYAEALCFGGRAPNFVLFETTNTGREAIGQALAANKLRVPAIVSFVLGQDGKILSGESLEDVVKEVDLASGGYLRGFGINCCHHDDIPVFSDEVRRRIVSIHPNAARGHELDCSHGVVGVKDSAKTAREVFDIAEFLDVDNVGGCCGYGPLEVRALSQEALRRVVPSCFTSFRRSVFG